MRLAASAMAVACVALSLPSDAGSAAGRSFFCHHQKATIVGTKGDDLHGKKLVGTPQADVIAARGGNDLIVARGGADLICGGSGKDFIAAGKGDDRAFGDPGHDVLLGHGGKDVLKGLKGNDGLGGGDGNDVCSGGAGDDAAQKRTCERIFSAKRV